MTTRIANPVPPARPRLLLPGLAPREPGLQTYRVRPGGVTAVRLAPGDRLTVVDPVGRQSAELTVLGPQGGIDGSALGVRADAPASVLRSLTGPGRGGILATLAAAGAVPASATAALLFGPWSPPGARESFTAEGPATVLVAAPAPPMSVLDEDANPPSELLLELRLPSRTCGRTGSPPSPARRCSRLLRRGRLVAGPGPTDTSLYGFRPGRSCRGSALLVRMRRTWDETSRPHGRTHAADDGTSRCQCVVRAMPTARRWALRDPGLQESLMPSALVCWAVCSDRDQRIRVPWFPDRRR